MPTIWSCDDYTIEKVSANASVNSISSTNQVKYVVEVQRLPAEQYPDITYLSIDNGVIPADTADSALLDLIIPQCNTEILNMDAANDADGFDYNSPKFTEITGL